MNEYIDKLRMLDDLPVVSDQDRFHHNVYAEMLRDVFMSNAPGLAVGLFGKWGQGKSTVVRILESLLPAEYRTVVFNAWKSRGDAVRRQLLLQVLKHIDSTQYKEISRFVCPGIPLRIRSYEEQHPYEKHRIWWLLTTAEKLDFWVIGALISALLMAGVAIFLFSKALATSNPHALLLWAIPFVIGLTISCMTVVFRWFQNRRQAFLTSAEPVSDSQRLRYPEQFQTVFEQEVSSFCAQGNKLLVVIDDLDRCAPETIVEALSAVRQFSDQKHIDCQFLIPCDEMQVVLALETAGHHAGTMGGRFHDYESEELLRKFFDVTIRMHELLSDDLSDYAASLSERIGLNEQEAREIVGLVNPRDPRLIKKLLNALRLSHERISIGQEKGIFPKPDELPGLPQTERLLVVLRETKPEIYRQIVINPSLLHPADTEEEWKQFLEDKKFTADCIESARKMIENSGGISVITAQELIYGQLPDELRKVPSAGKLIRAVRRPNHDEFYEVVFELADEHKPKVQQWLCRETSRVSSATGLNQILSLFVDYPAKGVDSDFIAPCVDAAIGRESLLAQALANYARFEQLEVLLPQLKPNKEQTLYKAVVENFTKSNGESERELRFLLATCKRMNPEIGREFQEWLVSSLGEKKDDEVVARLFQCMPEDRSKCSGFAPDVAVLAASASEWVNDHDEELRDDTERWPRHNLIITFVGDSEEHAARCLAAIFTENGQLASPQQITGSILGINPAWMTVGHLLSLVSDDELRENYDHIQNWLNHQSQPDGLETVLDALGENAFLLSSDQMGQIAQFLFNRFHSQPSETYLVDFIGKKPEQENLKDGWRLLVSEFIALYANWVEGRPTMSTHDGEILGQIHEYRWPVSEQVEHLLVQKMSMPNVSDFSAWLEALVPLIGNRRRSLRDAVKDCFNKNQRVEEAFSAGNRVLWKKEIDAEVAAVIGRFFIEYQSEIPNYSAGWESLREKQGSERVLEVMEENLPNESGTLVSYGAPLDMLAEGFEQLDAQHKVSFLDKRLVPLVSSTDSPAIEMCLNLASVLPVISEKLKKQLKSLQKVEELTEQQGDLIEEILKKPKV